MYFYHKFRFEQSIFSRPEQQDQTRAPEPSGFADAISGACEIKCVGLLKTFTHLYSKVWVPSAEAHKRVMNHDSVCPHW
jgi:hypothetical protein